MVKYKANIPGHTLDYIFLKLRYAELIQRFGLFKYKYPIIQSKYEQINLLRDLKPTFSFDLKSNYD